MLYQRSLDIEKRLSAVLGLIRQGGYSTPRIAEELSVSIPTVSRAVTALRQRGHDIQAERHGNAWRYILRSTKKTRRKPEVGIATALTM